MIHIDIDLDDADAGEIVLTARELYDCIGNQNDLDELVDIANREYAREYETAYGIMKAIERYHGSFGALDKFISVLQEMKKCYPVDSLVDPKDRF